MLRVPWVWVFARLAELLAFLGAELDPRMASHGSYGSLHGSLQNLSRGLSWATAPFRSNERVSGYHATFGPAHQAGGCAGSCVPKTGLSSRVNAPFNKFREGCINPG